MIIARHDDNRWLAMGILCLGALMIVLDVTIVNVALPSIRASLGFSETSLAWVVNIYMLIFGGFLLLGGRLGDLYGQRRLFLAGLTLFTLASLACGLAETREFLIAARGIQGLGGAVVDAVSLSLIVNLFPETAARAKAMAVYGFVCSGGGCIGALLGGVLTGTLNWHWIFLVNVPVGVLVYALCWKWVPAHTGEGDGPRHLDLGGAVTVTVALLLAVYAIINGNQAGWTSPQTLGLVLSAAAVFVLFLLIESRVRVPIVPLRLFGLRNLTVSCLTGILWSAGMFSWFFLSALYMQQVLGLTPMQIGLAFLPGNIIMAVFSLGASATLVIRFGVRRPLAAGLLIAAAGLLLFARVPPYGSLMHDVIPGMLLVGLGGGIAFNPVLMAAMSATPQADSGLASGVVNTAFLLGGSLGLAALASVASARTARLTLAGTTHLEALTGGYRAAFLVGAGLALLAALLSVSMLRFAPQDRGRALAAEP